MKFSGKTVAFAVAAVLATGALAMQAPDSLWTDSDSSATAATSESAAAGAAAISLKVDISARELYVIKDGDVIETYNVTVGTSKHPTPKGTFGVRRMIWNPKWVPPDAEWAKDKKARGPGDPKNPMGKVKIFFKEPDYYLHGTLSTKELGTAASHGCIRLSNANVTALGKMLMEYGGAKVEPGFIRSVINRVRSTREVRLQTPVTLQIVS